MRRADSFRQGMAFGPGLVIVFGLAACSGQQAGKDTGVLGYGTPGVSSYVGDGEATSLQVQLGRCSQVPQAGAATQTQGLPAACGQLQRTLRNQPGNAVEPAAAWQAGGDPARR